MSSEENTFRIVNHSNSRRNCVERLLIAILWIISFICLIMVFATNQPIWFIPFFVCFAIAIEFNHVNCRRLPNDIQAQLDAFAFGEHSTVHIEFEEQVAKGWIVRFMKDRGWHPWKCENQVLTFQKAHSSVANYV
jgi:hypothetical protein